MMTQTEIDARINALVQQRNSALDHIAVLAGQIAMLEQQLREMRRPPSPPTDSHVEGAWAHQVGNDAGA